jgi:hypothetical protein
MSKVRLSSLLAVSLLCGCTSVQNVDMSSGSAEKITVYPATYVIKRLLSKDDAYHIQIMEVDRIKIKDASDLLNVPVFVSPGQHTLKVRALNMNTSSGLVGWAAQEHQAQEDTSELKFNAETGKRYAVKANVVEYSNVLGMKAPEKYEFRIEPYDGNKCPLEELKLGE